MARTWTYNFDIDGQQISFCMDEDYTVPIARRIKAWFSDLANYESFHLAFLRGDPDAICCVRWIVLTKAGKKTREPNNMEDFGGVGNFMNSWVAADTEPCEACGGSIARGRVGRGWNPTKADEEENPTDRLRAGSQEQPSSDSPPETPTNSETAISDS